MRYLGVERDDVKGNVSIFLEYCAGGSIASLLERFASRDNFDYAGKALSAMRMQFGGHHEKKS